MRPANSYPYSYQPSDPPEDLAQLPRWWKEEQVKIKAALDAIADGFDPVVYTPPAKPRKGMRRNADGVSWNPGGGPGLYRFDGVVWKLLG